MADDEAIEAPRRTPPASADGPLLDALRRGDEGAFESIIDEHTPALLRLALLYAPTHAVAEEAVQETWLGVVRGVDSFEGRSSLRTWIFRILVNQAKSSGVAKRRHVHLAEEVEGDGEGPSDVDPGRFSGLPRGYWSSPPNYWDELPEDRLLAKETLEVIKRAAKSLSPHTSAAVQCWRSRSSNTACCRHPWLTCLECVESVTEFLEGALSPEDRTRVLAHLKVCPDCPRYFRQIELTIRLARELLTDSIPLEARAPRSSTSSGTPPGRPREDLAEASV